MVKTSCRKGGVVVRHKGGLLVLCDELMVASVKERWNAMTEDARATLECAFSEGIERPFLVSDYSCKKRTVCGVTVEMHRFYIGFACFVVATTPCGRSIVCDMTLRDGLPLYSING